MYRILLFLLLILISCTKNQPKLYIKSETINLGDIQLNHDQVIDVEIFNIGEELLKIDAIKSSCKCIVPDETAKTIRTNESLKIKLIFKSDSIGTHTETIVIVSNDPDNFKLIRINANVI